MFRTVILPSLVVCLASAVRLAVSGQLESRLTHANQAVASGSFESRLADGVEQQWCRSRTNRSYYFEMQYDDGSLAAARLERDVDWPRLHIYRDRVWSVQLVEETVAGSFGFTAQTNRLIWEPVVPDADGNVPADAEADESSGSIIDFRRDVSYVRSVPGEDDHSPATVEFGFPSGEVQSFAGGAYFPERAMQRALERSLREARAVQASRNETDVATAQAWNVSTDVSHFTATAGMSTLTNTLEGAKSGAMGLFVVTFFSGYGNIAMGELLRTAVGAAATGFGTGLALSLPLSLAISGSTQLYSYLRERRELRMAASEKLFEKLHCHLKIQRCRRIVGLLVPEPEVEEEEEEESWVRERACAALPF